MNNNFNDDQINVTNSQEPSMNGFSSNNNGENGTPMGQGSQNNNNNMGNQNNLNQSNMQGNNQLNGNNMNKNGAKMMGNFDKNKIIKIALIVVVVIVVLFILKGCSSVLGSHKNTTGSSEYNAKDVDYNCFYEKTDSDKKITAYIDVLFNYKDGNSTYATKQYIKKINEYPNGVTDEIYKDFIKSLNALECQMASDCTENHLELNFTKLGFNTVIDRTDNQIIAIYHTASGSGQEATKKDINTLMKEYEDAGIKCE